MFKKFFVKSLLEIDNKVEKILIGTGRVIITMISGFTVGKAKTKTGLLPTIVGVIIIALGSIWSMVGLEG